MIENAGPSVLANVSERDALLDRGGVALYDSVEVRGGTVRFVTDEVEDDERQWGKISGDWTSFFVVCFVVFLG